MSGGTQQSEARGPVVDHWSPIPSPVDLPVANSDSRPANWATDATPVSPYSVVSPFAEAPSAPAVGQASSSAADLSYAEPWLDEVCEATPPVPLDSALAPQRLATQGAISARVTEAQDAAEVGGDVGTFTARVDEARALMSKKPPDRERALAILRGLARSMQAIRQGSPAGPEVLESSDGRFSGSMMMSKGLAEVEIQAAKIEAGMPPQWERLRTQVATATESYGLSAGQRDPKTSQLGRADGTMQAARYGQLAAASLPLIPAIPQLISSAWTWALTNPITAVGVGELGVDVGLGMGQAGGVGNWLRGVAEEPAALIPYLMPLVPGWMFGKRGTGTSAAPRAPSNDDHTLTGSTVAQGRTRRLAPGQPRTGVADARPVEAAVVSEPTGRANAPAAEVATDSLPPMPRSLGARANITVRSAIKESPYAKRQAQGMSEQAQADVDHLLGELQKGNDRAGVGTRPLGGGFYELRGRNGGRVIVKAESAGSYVIVGKFQGHVRGDAANSEIINRLKGDYVERHKPKK